MKIKKSQLRRIIAEEKARLQKQMNETVADMRDFEEAVDSAALNIASMFADGMRKLEDEMSPGDISPTWQEEVDESQTELEEAIKRAINTAIQQVETQLHDGAFYRGSR